MTLKFKALVLLTLIATTLAGAYYLFGDSGPRGHAVDVGYVPSEKGSYKDQGTLSGAARLLEELRDTPDHLIGISTTRGSSHIAFVYRLTGSENEETLSAEISSISEQGSATIFMRDINIDGSPDEWSDNGLQDFWRDMEEAEEQDVALMFDLWSLGLDHF